MTSETPRLRLAAELASRPNLTDLRRLQTAGLVIIICTECFVIIPNVLTEMAVPNSDIGVVFIRLYIFALRTGTLIIKIANCCSCVSLIQISGFMFALFYIMVTPIRFSLTDGNPLNAGNLIIIGNFLLIFSDLLLLILSLNQEQVLRQQELDKKMLKAEVFRVRDGKVVFTDVCSICLEEYTEDDFVARLPCHHCYHAACYSEWSRYHVRCPLRCRGAVAPLPCRKYDRVVEISSSDPNVGRDAADEASLSEGGVEPRQGLPDPNASRFSNLQTDLVPGALTVRSEMSHDLDSLEASTDVEEGLATHVGRDTTDEAALSGVGALTLPSEMPHDLDSLEASIRVEGGLRHAI